METIHKTSPRDVFFQLLAIIMLYGVAVNFGVLLFQIINIYFPDPLNDGFYGDFSQHYGPLRFALASLIVMFPAYVWLSWSLVKELVRSPEKRELKIRKWLLNFTLFAAALVIVGDLVTLVYNYLNGELTFRFILKIFVIFFIAGAVFAYYLWNLKQEIPASKHPKMKFFVWGVIGLVSVSIVAGFVIGGSPQKERVRRFDQQRVTDLQNIQWSIVNYWQLKERLPKTLDALEDNISGYQAPVDPEAKIAYEYKILGKLKFQLCGVFNLESQANSATKIKMAYPAYPYPADQAFENWSHGKGRVCFERTIDPERYPVTKQRLY